MNHKEEDFEIWLKSLEGLDFKEKSSMILSKILPSLDSKSKRFIQDLYDFFIRRIEDKNEGIPISSLKTYLEIKGYDTKSIDIKSISSAMIILSLCGITFT